jgi:hypothetical protein
LSSTRWQTNVHRLAGKQISAPLAIYFASSLERPIQHSHLDRRRATY